MVSQHGSSGSSSAAPNSSSNKAAAILRASLSRRVDGGALHNSRHGPAGASNTGRESGRPPKAPTPAFPDVNYTSSGDVEVTPTGNEEGLALTDSIHGPDGISSSRHSRPSSRNSNRSNGSIGGNSLVHSGHGDIESALPTLHASSRTRAGSLGSVGRTGLASAASLVRQVSSVSHLSRSGSVSSVGNMTNVDLTGSTMRASVDVNGNVNLAPASSPTSAAHFPTSASEAEKAKMSQWLDKSCDDDEYYHHHGSSCCGRFMHTRWMQVVAAVAVVCIVGAAVGATVSRNNGNTNGSSGQASTVGGNPFDLGGNPNKDKDDDWKKWEEEHNYDDGDKYEVPEVVNEDMVPIGQQPGQQQDKNEQGTTEYVSETGAKPGTWITGGGNGPAGGSTTNTQTGTGTGTPIWLSATHFADPTLTTLGSTVSFSSDGYHLAISSAASSTVQIYQLNLSQGRNWTPLGTPLPGQVASMSGDGQKVAVADSAASTVTTYRYNPSTNSWAVYGTRIIDIWGARAVSLSDDGTTLAVSHYPDSICRICPSVASVFELMDYGLQGQWVQEYDVLGAYDFDFSIELSGDGSTLVFSGRVYENALGRGQWQVKNAFPDFISSHSALSGNGMTAAVSLPDCHIFKNTDPTLTDCTNTEPHEVSVMEYRDSSTGGWWNRKGISIGPTSDGLAGTTALALSRDGNTVAIAVGGAGFGGEAALDGGAVGGFSGGAVGTSIPNNDALRGPPLRRRRLQDQPQEQERFDDSNEDFLGYDAYDVEEAYVRVYRYDDRTGDWHIVGEDIVLDASGATLALSADGHRLAVGSPYGGTDERGYVKVYDLVMQ